MVASKKGQCRADRTFKRAHAARQGRDGSAECRRAEDEIYPIDLSLGEECQCDEIISDQRHEPVERHPEQEAQKEPAVCDHSQTVQERFEETAAISLEGCPARTQFVEDIQRPLPVERENIHHYQTQQHDAADDIADARRALGIGHKSETDQQECSGVDQVHHAFDYDSGQDLAECQTGFSTEQKDTPDLTEAEGQKGVQQISFACSKNDIHVFRLVAQQGLPNLGSVKQPHKGQDCRPRENFIVRILDGFPHGLEVHEIQDGGDDSNADQRAGDDSFQVVSRFGHGVSLRFTDHALRNS